MTIVTSSPALSQVGDRAFTSGTLLIPNHLVLYFRARSGLFKGTKHYFQHLIVTYARHMIQYGLQPLSNKWKKEYQADGLDLQKKSFKPDPLLWEEFRHISFSYGLAMCKLFTILLELEYKRWMEAGCPEIFHEKLPKQSKIKNHDMNSSYKHVQNTKSILKNLLNSQNSNLLIRNIDFGKLSLDRVGLIRCD